MNNISILVGLKNNLDYSKHFYRTTRDLYPDVEIVFTSYNSTDGTNEWLDSLTDKNLIYFHSPENKTFSDTYNKCIALATKEYIVFAHNDVVLAPGFIENLQQYISDKNVVCYTTIEPPVFADDERPGKIVMNFGHDLKSFKKNEFYSFSEKLKSSSNADTKINGSSFFLSVNKNILSDIGGFDPLYNPMFSEDIDLLLRFELLGLNIFIVSDVICYHFVSKTSRFSDEYKTDSQQIDINSNKNFFRKWGFKTSSPVKKTYNIGLIIENSDEKLLPQLEPLCSTIYIDCDPEPYIAAEQPNTLFNLTDKIKPLAADRDNDILITFNGELFNDKALKKLERINEIITDKVNHPLNFIPKFLGMDKSFRSGIFLIQIANFISYEDQLIKLDKK